MALTTDEAVTAWLPHFHEINPFAGAEKPECQICREALLSGAIFHPDIV